MPVEVLNGIYQIEVCLPNNPLKALNSYLIKGKDRNLIIDTGFNRDECKADMNNALRDLKVSLDDTDFFITHHHADHSGLISYLAAESSRVFCSKESASSISSGRAGGIWHEMRNYALLSGFPDEELAEVMETNPAYKYCNEGGRPLTVIEDGETLAVGPYGFICIHTPGHTSGHFCLYEPREKILFSGDNILADITPNITSWSEIQLLEAVPQQS
ncbi:MAG: MBL fold metallo-hydrolase [Eubacteriales bacterium]